MVIIVPLILIALIGYGSYIVKITFALSLKLSIPISLFILLSPILGVIARNFIQNRTILTILNWGVYPLFGTFTLLLSFSIFRDLILLSGKFINLIAKESGNPSLLPIDLLYTKQGLVGLAVVTLLFSIYAIVNAFSPKLKEITIDGKGLTQNLKIVQISDIHISYLIGKSFIDSVVEKVNNQKPDIVVLTGDLADGNMDHFKEEMEILSKIKPKYGKYFVTGNHAYYNNTSKIIKMVRESGFIDLPNRGINLKELNLYIGGVLDYSVKRFGERSDVEESLKNSKMENFKLLLAHQPKSFPDAKKFGYDLTLSGHTHGGQYFPGNLLVKLDQPYLSGVYSENNSTLYVNEGTGFWGPPLRLGTNSEITIINLMAVQPDRRVKESSDN